MLKYINYEILAAMEMDQKLNQIDENYVRKLMPKTENTIFKEKQECYWVDGFNEKRSDKKRYGR